LLRPAASADTRRLPPLDFFVAEEAPTAVTGEMGVLAARTFMPPRPSAIRVDGTAKLETPRPVIDFFPPALTLGEGGKLVTGEDIDEPSFENNPD
jgi:hypothetical protein